MDQWDGLFFFTALCKVNPERKDWQLLDCPLIAGFGGSMPGCTCRSFLKEDEEPKIVLDGQTTAALPPSGCDGGMRGSL